MSLDLEFPARPPAVSSARIPGSDARNDARREIKENPIKISDTYTQGRYIQRRRSFYDIRPPLKAALSESTHGSAWNCESSSSRSTVNSSGRRNAPCRGPSRSTARYGLSLEKGHYARYPLGIPSVSPRYPLGMFLRLAIIKSTAGQACRSRYE